MKITDIIKNNKMTVSFEMFPPKKWDKIESSKEIAREMAKQNPSFMSVTYGAGGTTAGYTMELTNEIKSMGVTPLYHLSCITETKEKINSVLDNLEKSDIENVLALRGDIPDGFEYSEQTNFHYAYELVKIIKKRGKFCIGAACYPETHPESKNAVDDLFRLKEKVDAGVDFLTTQMFFDNDLFFDFKERCKLVGINVPIIAGMMAITNTSQIDRSIQLSGSKFPKKFIALLDRFGQDSVSMRRAGIIYALDQIVDLIARGQNNIHIYTMNHSSVSNDIMKGLADIIHGQN